MPMHGSPDAFLSVNRVCKSYDGRNNVVADVDLDIHKGEFVTFLGPSGSGKTTTLSMIAGFETPTSGDIRVNGKSLLKVPVHKRNVGLVFQNYALFPHMSALDNVSFPLRMRRLGRADIEKKARRALAIVDLEQHAGRMPAQLSGGQQQRVALARALVFEPDVLLLDEPLSALDKNLRVQMQIEIKRLHCELNMTTVFVTHDQSEAMTMSDRIAVFNQGRVEQFAAPLEIYSRPGTRFVGGFIGESNFLDVTVIDGASGQYHSADLGPLRAAPSTAVAGTALTLMLRPEWIRLGEAVSAGAAPQTPAFAVSNVINYGDSALITGTIGQKTVKIKIAQIDLPRIRAQARYAIAWDPAHSHLLPPD